MDPRSRLDEEAPRVRSVRDDDARCTMADATTLDRAVRRDDLAVLLDLTAITVLAWGYLLVAAGGGGVAGAAMGAARTWMMGPTQISWTPFEAASVLVMWGAMMVAMMLPTAAPAVLTYAWIGRQRSSQSRPFVGTAWFVAGYLLAWSGVALAATAVQWCFGQAGWFDPTTGRGHGLFAGLIFLAAGLYQLTPVKDRCLRLCQAPMRLLQRHGGYREDRGGALRLGVIHGVCCVGCCWCLMLLLFAVGVMNLAWIAVISAFILLEKIVPSDRLVSRLAALGLAATGETLVFVALRAMGMPH